MTRPTEKELSIALERATYIREKGEDTHFLSKSLLSHDYRIKKLEHVMEAAKHHLRSGGGFREHHDLLKAIEVAEEAGHRPGEEPDITETLMI